MADKHNLSKGMMYSKCRLLPDDIVCKITQRHNITRANTCGPVLKQQKTQHPSHPVHKHTTYFNTQRLKKTLFFNNGRYTTNISTDPHTVSTTDIKTNMRHIHTSIASRHLATRGNNKRTPPPNVSSSEKRLPRLTHRTIAQLRTNKFPFLKSYLHKVNAKSHPSPLYPL